MAATKIYDGTILLQFMKSLCSPLLTGTAVPWGEVSRKKDKKLPTPTHTSKPSTSGRGDSRGARGGRGGRGAAGRGGPIARGGRGGSSKSGTNGHAPHPDSPRPSHLKAVTVAVAVEFSGCEGESVHSDVEGVKPSCCSSDSLEILLGASSLPSAQFEGVPLVSGNSMASTWGHTTEANGNTATHAAAPRQASKTPATSKLSWAQVARYVTSFSFLLHFKLKLSV